MTTGQDNHTDPTSSITISIEEYNKFKIYECEYNKLKELEYELLYLKEELAKLKRMIFGQRSERFIADALPNQLMLNLGVSGITPEIQTEKIEYTRQKQQPTPKPAHSRSPIPERLRREEIIIEPEEDLTGAKKIGENITEVLEYKPGEIYVKKYIRPKYALPEEKGIVTAQLPSFPIPKGNFGPSLLAQIIVGKFVDHLPYYRQVQIYKRLGMPLAESSIYDGFRHSMNLMQPLYDLLKTKILKCDYLMADETPIAVLESDKPRATHNGYYWVYYSPVERLVLFEYQKSRSREGPENFLRDFLGSLQTDGYAAYDSFEKREGIILLACMAHARRKFKDAEAGETELSAHVLEEIQKLYAIEELARNLKLSPEERKTLRQKESAPILTELEKWLKQPFPQILPQSSFGKAIHYTLRLWPRLTRYLDDGRYEIDNNLIENKIRPVALGKKNYLFAGSHNSAQHAAMIYSFLGTCAINEVNPYEWLTDVLTRISDCKLSQLHELLPSNWVKPAKE